MDLPDDPYLRRLVSSRRAFLKAGAALVGAAALGCGGKRDTPPTTEEPAPPPTARDVEAVGPPPRPVLTKMGSVLGGGRGKHRSTGAWSYWLSAVDLDHDGRRTHDIPTAFFPHGITPHPHEPHRVLLFEKKGAGCCEVDLRERRVVRTIGTRAGQRFYGHGAYSPDGRRFYCTETAVDDGYRGLLNVRDGASCELLGELPTGGKEPHDCVLIAGGRTLVVTNGGGHVDNGGHGSVTYVDVASRKVVHELRFSDPTLNAGHLWLTSKGHLAVVSAPRGGLDVEAPEIHGALSFFSPGRDAGLRTIGEPILGQMRGETLSVVIHEPSMVVGATNPDGDLLTFWEHASGKLLKAFRHLRGPRGIALTLDQRYFVVSYDDAALLTLIDVKTLEPVVDTKVSQSFMTGSHLLPLDLG